MKKLSLLFALFFSLTALATAPEKVTVVIRIQSMKEGSLGHALRIKDKKTQEQFNSLSSEEEVLLQGYVEYEQQKRDGTISIQPTFIVESIKPVSLKKLGKMEDFKVEEKTVSFKLEPAPYQPRGFQASPQVTGAITITAAVLLLRSLTAPKNEPQVLKEGNNGILFSAGALATGVFVWDQVKEKPAK